MTTSSADSCATWAGVGHRRSRSPALQQLVVAADEGALVIAGSSVTSASFGVDVAELTSNDSQRQALDVANHPRAVVEVLLHLTR
jgi:hypothetical protein